MDTMPRYIKIDDWFFEVKAVRALRSVQYGDQYSAIANFNCNGDTMYVDGLMTREQERFSHKDFQTFKKFCSQMNVKEANFDRFKEGGLASQRVIIEPYKSPSILQLVK